MLPCPTAASELHRLAAWAATAALPLPAPDLGRMRRLAALALRAPAPGPAPGCLTTAEASILTGIPQARIRDLIASGRVSAAKDPAGHWMLTRAAALSLRHVRPHRTAAAEA